MLYTVSIYGLKWIDHRRDARLATTPFAFSFSAPTYPVTSTFPFAVSSTSNSNLFNYFINDDHGRVLDPHELYHDEIKREVIYILVSCGVIVIIALVLLFAFCCDCLSHRTRHILIALLMVLIFALAIVLLLRHCNNEDLEDTPIPYHRNMNFETGNNAKSSWRCTFQFIQTNTLTSILTTNW